MVFDCALVSEAAITPDPACKHWPQPPSSPAAAASSVGMSACRSISFTFSTQTGNTVGVAFECALVPGNQTEAATTFVGCSSPVVYNGLANGAWQFFVRAVGEDIAASSAFLLVTFWWSTHCIEQPCSMAIALARHVLRSS